MIIPPLTVNFTDYILACKGKLGRRGQQSSTFSDDGFIIGTVFLFLFTFE